MKCVPSAIALLLGTLGLTASPSMAYQPYETDDGIPLRWFERPDPITFHLASVAPQEVTLEAVGSVLEAAFGQWAAAPCGTVPAIISGGASAATGPTWEVNDNVVVFIRSSQDWQARGGSSSQLSLTLIRSNPDTGEILDADIILNDAGYRFTTTNTPGDATDIDLRPVLLADAGHFLGLDRATDPSAAMYPFYTDGARSLAQDDLDGICASYTDVPQHCEPQCQTKVCGDDGCGATCGESTAAARTLGPQRVRRTAKPAARSRAGPTGCERYGERLAINRQPLSAPPTRPAIPRAAVSRRA